MHHEARSNLVDYFKMRIKYTNEYIIGDQNTTYAVASKGIQNVYLNPNPRFHNYHKNKCL